MTDLRTEAALLTEVLVERLSALRGAVAATGTPTPDATAEPICSTCGHDATRTDCAGCPVCAVLAVLRGERPELTAALLDGAITAVTAVRALLDSSVRPATSSADTPSPDSGSASHPDPHPDPDPEAATDPHPTDPVAVHQPAPRRSERISIT